MWNLGTRFPAPRYPIPAGPHRVEQTIRRSRFITTLAPAPKPEAAHDFIEAIRTEFPDATHHCWAFAAGPPGDTAAVGMSDDGEPRGTAGRPILEALLHSGVGEVAAVVTRYYGGVRLGTGGLQRAYSGGVRLALESLTLSERVEQVVRVVTVEYSALDPVRRAAADLGAEIRAETFTDDVRVEVAVPAGSVDRFVATIAELTAGKGRVREPDSLST